jgi:hypothetical protein
MRNTTNSAIKIVSTKIKARTPEPLDHKPWNDVFIPTAVMAINSPQLERLVKTSLRISGMNCKVFNPARHRNKDKTRNQAALLIGCDK